MKTNKNRQHDQKYILIVDDTQQNLTFLSDLLQERGYYVKRVREDTEILSIIAKDTPDVILINSLMAGIDSYQFCEKIKSTDQYCSIPIIFLNRDDPYFQPAKVYQVGGDDYLNYPFPQEEVLTRMETQIRLRYLQQQLRQKETLLGEYRQKAEIVVGKTTNHQALKHIDNLTGLATHAHLRECLTQEWFRGARERISFGDVEQTSLSLILADIDHFKLYNHKYGFQQGDICLKAIAQTIASIVHRPADLVARYGPETFAILLPNTDSVGAVEVAHKINAAVNQLQIPHSFSSTREHITLSVAVITGIPSQALPADILITDAENALAQAKEAGGDRLVEDSF